MQIAIGQRARAVKRQHDVVFMISAPDRPCKLLAGPVKPRQRCRSLVATLRSWRIEVVPGLGTPKATACPVRAEPWRLRSGSFAGFLGLPRALGAMDHRLQATSLNFSLRGGEPVLWRAGSNPAAGAILQWPRCLWGHQSGAKSPHSKGWALAALGPSRPAPSDAIFERGYSNAASGGTKRTRSCRCVRTAEAALPTHAALEDRSTVPRSYPHA